jgi:hypothetical protein
MTSLRLRRFYTNPSGSAYARWVHGPNDLVFTMLQFSTPELSAVLKSLATGGGNMGDQGQAGRLRFQVRAARSGETE